MPAERKTNQSTRLTAAGLIAVTAATLLMMAWAIFPMAAFANRNRDNGRSINGLADRRDLPATAAHWILSAVWRYHERDASCG